MSVVCYTAMADMVKYVTVVDGSCDATLSSASKVPLLSHKISFYMEFLVPLVPSQTNTVVIQLLWP